MRQVVISEVLHAKENDLKVEHSPQVVWIGEDEVNNSQKEADETNFNLRKDEVIGEKQPPQDFQKICNGIGIKFINYNITSQRQKVRLSNRSISIDMNRSCVSRYDTLHRTK